MVVEGRAVVVVRKHQPRLLGKLRRICQIKHGQLQPLLLPGVLVRLHAQPEQQILPVNVQVFGKAGDLQLREELRAFRVAHVYGKEGIRLAEGHKIGCISQEAGGIDLLPFCQAVDLSGKLQVFIQNVKSAGKAVILRDDIFIA